VKFDSLTGKPLIVCEWGCRHPQDVEALCEIAASMRDGRARVLKEQAACPHSTEMLTKYENEDHSFFILCGPCGKLLPGDYDANAAMHVKPPEEEGPIFKRDLGSYARAKAQERIIRRWRAGGMARAYKGR